VRISTAGKAPGTHLSTPIVAGGVIYVQDQRSNVRAIDFHSGSVLWERRFHAPTKKPNGLAAAAGRVYGATPTSAFALDPKTGREIWSTQLVRGRGERIEMAPGYHEGLVYVSSRPARFKGGEVGVLWALDAATGKVAWSFDTVPRGLWGHPKVNFGGGLASAPAFDDEGSMYVGVGDPGPAPGTPRYPWGSSRPGPNLYTDSVVKLSARTGKVEWHYQITPHAVCGWRFISPMLLRVGGRELVIAGAASGVVVALDSRTGHPVWKQQVGYHNTNDSANLVALRREYSKLEPAMTVFPGFEGGVASPLATNGSTLFASVLKGSTRMNSEGVAVLDPYPTGELVALDAATGKVKWTQGFSWAMLGPPTAVNDLVLATTLEGVVYAFNGRTGVEAWSASMPAGIDAGLAVSGDTLLVPAGVRNSAEETPELVAYRLSGK